MNDEAVERMECRVRRFYEVYMPLPPSAASLDTSATYDEIKQETKELIDERVRRAMFAYGDGRYDELLSDLEAKYGPEPPPRSQVRGFVVNFETDAKDIQKSVRETVAVEPTFTQHDQQTEDSTTAGGAIIRNLPPTTSGGSRIAIAHGTLTREELNKYRERLINIYLVHCPQYVLKVEDAMIAYKGREEQMIADAVGKYGPEPDLEGAKARLELFYDYYCPEKKGHVDEIVRAFVGETEHMFAMLCEMYGPEPVAADMDEPTQSSSSKHTRHQQQQYRQRRRNSVADHAATTELRLSRFYEYYAPEKSCVVPDIVRTVYGDTPLEVQGITTQQLVAMVFEDLTNTYGPEPSEADLMQLKEKRAEEETIKTKRRTSRKGSEMAAETTAAADEQQEQEASSKNVDATDEDGDEDLDGITLEPYHRNEHTGSSSEGSSDSDDIESRVRAQRRHDRSVDGFEHPSAVQLSDDSDASEDEDLDGIELPTIKALLSGKRPGRALIDEFEDGFDDTVTPRNRKNTIDRIIEPDELDDDDLDGIELPARPASSEPAPQYQDSSHTPTASSIDDETATATTDAASQIIAWSLYEDTLYQNGLGQLRDALGNSFDAIFGENNERIAELQESGEVRSIADSDDAAGDDADLGSDVGGAASSGVIVDTHNLANCYCVFDLVLGMHASLDRTSLIEELRFAVSSCLAMGATTAFVHPKAVDVEHVFLLMRDAHDALRNGDEGAARTTATHLHRLISNPKKFPTLHAVFRGRDAQFATVEANQQLANDSVSQLMTSSLLQRSIRAHTTKLQRDISAEPLCPIRLLEVLGLHILLTSDAFALREAGARAEIEQDERAQMFQRNSTITRHRVVMYTAGALEQAINVEDFVRRRLVEVETEERELLVSHMAYAEWRVMAKSVTSTQAQPAVLLETKQQVRARLERLFRESEERERRLAAIPEEELKLVTFHQHAAGSKTSNSSVNGSDNPKRVRATTTYSDGFLVVDRKEYDTDAAEKDRDSGDAFENQDELRLVAEEIDPLTVGTFTSPSTSLPGARHTTAGDRKAQRSPQQPKEQEEAEPIAAASTPKTEEELAAERAEWRQVAERVGRDHNIQRFEHMLEVRATKAQATPHHDSSKEEGSGTASKRTGLNVSPLRRRKQPDRHHQSRRADPLRVYHDGVSGSHTKKQHTAEAETAVGEEADDDELETFFQQMSAQERARFRRHIATWMNTNKHPQFYHLRTARDDITNTHQQCELTSPRADDGTANDRNSRAKDKLPKPKPWNCFTAQEATSSTFLTGEAAKPKKPEPPGTDKERTRQEQEETKKRRSHLFEPTASSRNRSCSPVRRPSSAKNGKDNARMASAYVTPKKQRSTLLTAKRRKDIHAMGDESFQAEVSRIVGSWKKKAAAATSPSPRVASPSPPLIGRARANAVMEAAILFEHPMPGVATTGDTVAQQAVAAREGAPRSSKLPDAVVASSLPKSSNTAAVLQKWNIIATSPTRPDSTRTTAKDDLTAKRTGRDNRKDSRSNADGKSGQKKQKTSATLKSGDEATSPSRVKSPVQQRVGSVCHKGKFSTMKGPTAQHTIAAGLAGNTKKKRVN